MYDLVAVVVHCGSGPNRGHYISIVKSCGFWLIFDDDIVDVSKIKSHLTENSKYLFYRKLSLRRLKISMDWQQIFKNHLKLDTFYSTNLETVQRMFEKENKFILYYLKFEVTFCLKITEKVSFKTLRAERATILVAKHCYQIGQYHSTKFGRKC